ncbi:MAG: glycosyltransferase [Thermoplasmata archaeon]
MTTPSLTTVIVTAFHRRTFLSDAVASVLDQRFPPDRREVVVVRDFDGDLPTDRRGPGVIDLRPTLSESGAYINAALEQTSGEIVTFLDDDDLWETSRLEWIRDKFDRDPDLGYIRNANRTVDRHGRHLPTNRRGIEEGRIWEPIGAHPRRLTDTALNEPSAAAVILAAPGNSSSIAVRRSVIEPVRYYLKDVQFALDSFLLYAALASGRTLLFDPTVLTWVRLHHEELSHSSAASFAQFQSRYADTMTRFAHDWGVIDRMLGDGGRSDLRAFAAAERRKVEYFADLAHGPSRRAIFRQLRDESRSEHHAPGSWRASARLALLSPRLSLWLSYEREQRQWRAESNAARP